GRTSMQKPPNHFNVQDLSPREVLESIDQFFVEGHISQYPEFAVPSLTDHIYLKEDCILARLSDDDFHISHKCIIISSHGRPSMEVRGLVRSLKLRFQLPIFALVDFDPAGIDIMVSFEYGSKNSALYNSNLITKGIKWLGVKQASDSREF
ncbi:DNA topoisomerase 6 subunit A-like, partial [Trifolium medium]|nr:DNA topoisomerase 6 subunit A-like [Trifolium medium]